MSESLFDSVPRPEVRHLAIGIFDGVHLGHQRIIQHTLRDLVSSREAAVLTFSPHPLTIIAPAQAPKRLTTEVKKKELIQAQGVSEVVVIRFDEELRQLAAQDFACQLHRLFPGLVEVTVGTNWRFGHAREGTVDSLRIMGLSHGYFARSVDPLLYEGSPVSSTRIRESIALRDFGAAAAMLGRSYSVQGVVESGEGRGKELGFPTANVGGIDQLMPPLGVYAAKVRVGGSQIPAVLNYGKRPTVSDTGLAVLEAHLIDFKGDLYGQSIEVGDWVFLREERTFGSLEQLQEQIARDVEQARELPD